MPSSGTVTYSLNRNQIITASLMAIGYLGDGEVASANDISAASDILNMLVKNWSGSSDFAPGFKLWSRKRGNLLLDTTKNSYNLGPSGDRWTDVVTRTTLTATAAAAAASLTVASISGIANTNAIGIVLDNGTLFWTTVNGTPSGVTVTLTVGLTSQASKGATVYAYASLTRRPLEILTAVLRDSSNQDTDLDVMTIQDYQSLPAKADSTTTGDPQSFYYESQLTNGVLYLDIYPNDLTKYVHCVYLSPIEDFNAATDTIDMPQVWYLPLMYGLGIHASPTFRMPVSDQLNGLFTASLAIAKNADPEQSTIFFEPGRDY